MELNEIIGLIPEDKREAVFEPFFRLEGSRNRNSGGVGLGMTIAREAAQRLGIGRNTITRKIQELGLPD